MTQSERRAYAYGVLGHANGFKKKDCRYKFENPLYDYWHMGFNECPSPKVIKSKQEKS